jgi:hypothetical protein
LENAYQAKYVLHSLCRSLHRLTLF